MSRFGLGDRTGRSTEEIAGDGRSRASAEKASLSRRARTSSAGLVAHVSLAVALSTIAHFFLASGLDATADEAWKALLAVDGLSSEERGPAFIWFVQATIALFGRSTMSVRTPSLVLFCLLPVVIAAASNRFAGRRAAVRGAWLCCAIPLTHVFGTLASAAVLSSIAWACAAFSLVSMARAEAPSAGVERGGGASFGAGHPVVLAATMGLAAAVASLASPHGWLLPVAAIIALLSLPSAKGGLGRLPLLLLVAGPPLVGWFGAGVALGDLGWPWSGLASGAIAGDGTSAHLLQGGFPLLVLFLGLGVGPVALVAMTRWAGWGLRPSAAAPRRLARALFLLGGLPFIVLLLISSVVPVDAMHVAAVLPPVLVGLAAWKDLDGFISSIRATSIVLLAVLGLIAAGVVPLLPEDQDPVAGLRGWSAVGGEVETWCGTIPDEGGARVLARPALTSRLALYAPSCEPIGLIDGPQESERSLLHVEEVVLVVHPKGKIPLLPGGCVAGEHAAEAGPDHLSIVVRPSRCRSRPPARPLE